MDNIQTQKHYNQTPRRKAEFISPPNRIKQKVGSGGISEYILSKAQELLESNSVDFLPLAEIYLSHLMEGIQAARIQASDSSDEYIISTMIYPAMQLKANGSMFHYPLVTTMADKMIQFLEVVETPDEKATEIVLAFHDTMRIVIQARIQGDGGSKGRNLIKALDDACQRYFDKYRDT